MHALDEGLLAGFLADGGSGAGLKGPSRDGVDAELVLAAHFPGQGAGVALQLGFGRGHAPTVAGNHLLSTARRAMTRMVVVRWLAYAAKRCLGKVSRDEKYK